MKTNKPIPLLHGDVAQEIATLSRGLLEASTKISELAVKMSEGNPTPGSFTLIQAASLVNMMIPVIRVADFVEETKMRDTRDQFEKVLIENGATKMEYK